MAKAPQRTPPALPDRASAVVPSMALASRLRVPLTFDPIGQSGSAISQGLLAARLRGASNLYAGIQQVHSSLSELLTSLAAPTAPAQLIGSLIQPDGTAGALLQIQFDPATLGSKSPVATTVTDSAGAFHLALPPGMKLAADASLTLQVHGGNGNAAVAIPAGDIASNGLVSARPLPQYLRPLQESIVASLLRIVSHSPGSVAAPKPSTPAQLHAVKLGDCDEGCNLDYGAHQSVDRFPFGVFHRLVEPRASIVSQAVATKIGNAIAWLPHYASEVAHANPVGGGAGAGGEGDVSYIDRIPVEQPISVDGFRDQLMGLQENGTFTADETRPMAGTLGLGYTLWMAQRWTYQGLALGNLVYSLPLAPGEQQQVAIFERTDTSSVFESEAFTEEQQLEESARADTSTNATFNSAFRESLNGQSSFHTDSSSSSWGGSLILISGGGGSSSSDGTTQSSLQGQRDTTQSAAQTTHSAAENQAAARRSAARTGMRVATASESEQVTTKTITNHNHTRALTMQYWEVQRIYDVTTTIEGLTMTVLVPLQVVRFMPSGQPQTLTNPNQLSTRQAILNRYGVIVKHGDILLQALPRKYRKGLAMLLEFASDPSANVDASSASAEDVVQFTLHGSFLSCDRVTVTVVTSRGTRVGPCFLSNPAAKPPADKFTTQEELVNWLLSQRREGSTVLNGSIALPQGVSRAEVVGFEVHRTVDSVSYTLQPASIANLESLVTLFGSNTGWINPALQSNALSGLPRTTVSLTGAELESTLGGPMLQTFSAQVTGGITEQYTPAMAFGTILPQQPYPIPASHIAPLLKYKQVLEIEQMATHVVRQTLLYSKAIWSSMSAEERAILLEAYTIGVPTGGIKDATQMVPLLNCVENRVLGYFGNSMMLPFIMPESLMGTSVEGQSVDPLKIQEALLSFHADGFQPPHSTIALPTRGVLGEAVLGSCPSAEKVDITRFWNWQDSPADTAPTISPTSLPTSSPSLTAGVTAPNSLTQLPSLINNVLTAPTPDNSLLTALGADALNQKSFDTSITGASQLAGLLTNAQDNANKARGDALATTKQLTGQAMATVGNIVGGIYGGNPNAGSNAAAAMNGGQQLQSQGQNQNQQRPPGSGTNNQGPGAGPGSGPGAGPGSGPGAGPGSGPGAGPGSGPGAGPGAGGAGPGAGPGSGPGAGPGAGPGSGPGAGPGG